MSDDTWKIGGVVRPLPWSGPLPEAEHHANAALGSSDIRSLIESPAAYKFGRKPIDPTVAAHGTAVHWGVGDPEAFERLVVPRAWVFEDAKKRSGPMKEAHGASNAHKAFVAAHKERTDGLGVVMTIEQYRNALAEIDALLRYEYAGDLWDRSWLVEHSFFWRDRDYGVVCKARPDLLSLEKQYPTERIAVDIKTAAKILPGAWDRHATDMGYHIQGEHYRRGLAANDCSLRAFCFLAVGKTPPHPAQLSWFGLTAREEASRLIDEVLALWVICDHHNDWPKDIPPRAIEHPPWRTQDTERALDRIDMYRRAVKAGKE